MIYYGLIVAFFFFFLLCIAWLKTNLVCIEKEARDYVKKNVPDSATTQLEIKRIESVDSSIKKETV